MRVLAVTSAELIGPPGMTVAAGLPGYESISIRYFAPARTPRVLIDKLNQEIVRILNRADIRAKSFSTLNGDDGRLAEQLAATVLKSRGWAR